MIRKYSASLEDKRKPTWLKTKQNKTGKYEDISLGEVEVMWKSVAHLKMYHIQSIDCIKSDGDKSQIANYKSHCRAPVEQAQEQ